MNRVTRVLRGSTPRMPDVVVMDYLMQGMDAAQFVGLLRGRGFGGPLILCTGFKGDFGLDARTIHKPFDPDDLVALIREVLGDNSAN